MWRDENYFLTEIKKDTTLFSIFMQLGNRSVVRQKNELVDYFAPNSQSLNELLNLLSSKLEKNNKVLQHYIDTLIKWGLVKYVIEDKDNEEIDFDNGTDDKDEERYNSFVTRGFPNDDCYVILTSGTAYVGCTGITLYRKIVIDKEKDELLHEHTAMIEKAFETTINELVNPYKIEINNLKCELEKKVEEVNKNLNDGVIKNIQILSIFAGMISLLFANIMGIKEFTSIGVIGLLIINLSMIISIFILLLFTKWIIIGEKVEWQQILGCAVIIIVLVIPIILIKTGILLI